MFCSEPESAGFFLGRSHSRQRFQGRASAIDQLVNLSIIGYGCASLGHGVERIERHFSAAHAFGSDHRGATRPSAREMEVMSNTRSTSRATRLVNVPAKRRGATPVKKPGPRSPRGRKAAHAGTESRQRILDVATQEFSAKGYDGARVDDIMRVAKVSKNLIYHYFGSKERLFIAVLEAAYQGMHDYHSTWTLDDVSPTEGIGKLVRSTFEYWAKSPEFIGLLNSENFHRGRHLRKSRLTKDGYSGLLEKLTQLLKHGEETGEFRASVDPVELYISISALAYHYLSNRYTLAYLLDRKLLTEDDKNARISHIQELILAYLREGGSASRP